MSRGFLGVLVITLVALVLSVAIGLELLARPQPPASPALSPVAMPVSMPRAAERAPADNPRAAIGDARRQAPPARP
jgi:hypothetical protein